jgi:uncharacterized membrane protein
MVQQVDNGEKDRLWKEDLVPIERDRPDYHVSPGYLPEIRQLSMGQPLVWLRKGQEDLRRHPFIAIAYGALIAVIYAAIVAFAVSTQLYHLGIQLTAGFVLLAPLVALGFYGVSKRAEQGERVSFVHMFRAWGHNPNGVLGLGAVLVLLFMVWFMISMQTTAFLAAATTDLAVFFGPEPFPQFTQTLLTELTIPVIVGYLGIGLLAVLVAFSLTAVSIPLLMDRPDTDAITALVISYKAVTRNWKPMLWWAILIAFFTGLGLVFFYIGLAVTMPLLGFATWHAYRDTLGEWREVEQPHVAYY